MTAASEIPDHQARWLSYLISLQMLAQGEAGVPLPRWAAAEGTQATSAILAEANAARCAALTVVGSGHRTAEDGTLLRVLLDGLSAAADDAVAAARAGNSADIGRHLP